MKLYEIIEPKGIDSLKLTERPTPKPGPREVLIRVRAASRNYRDLALIRGGMARMMKLPLIPVSDGAGDVVERSSMVCSMNRGRERGDLNPRKPFRVYTLSGLALKPSAVRTAKGLCEGSDRLSKDAPLKPTWRVCSARAIPIVLQFPGRCTTACAQDGLRLTAF